MDINQGLIDKIMKQLEDVYPDSLNSTNNVLPELKTAEEREQIRKHLIYLRDKNRIEYREGEGARGSSPLLFGIRIIPD